MLILKVVLVLACILFCVDRICICIERLATIKAVGESYISKEEGEDDTQ